MIALISDLPVEQRVEIVDRILQTFHQIDPEVEEAWMNEIQRRENEYKEGKATLIPGEQVMQRLRAITKGKFGSLDK